MSDHPRIQKALLLSRMEADRVALRLDEPPRTRSDFRVSPELQPWILPTALFGLSLLRMPPAMKAPLRAMAILLLKRRVSDVVDTARAGVRGSGPGTSRRPARLPRDVEQRNRADIASANLPRANATRANVVVPPVGTPPANQRGTDVRPVIKP